MVETHEQTTERSLQPRTPQLQQLLEALSSPPDKTGVGRAQDSEAPGRVVVRSETARARAVEKTELYKGRWYTREEFGRVCLAEWELVRERKRRLREEAHEAWLDREVLRQQQYKEERRRREQREREAASWRAEARRAVIAASREPPKPVRRKSVYLTFSARRRVKAALTVVVMIISVLAVLSSRPRFDFGIVPTKLRAPTAVEQSASPEGRRGPYPSSPGLRHMPRHATKLPRARRLAPNRVLPSARIWPFPLPPAVGEAQETDPPPQ